MSFTHLHVHSNFSFLDAGSSVQSLLDRAKTLGSDSLADGRAAWQRIARTAGTLQINLLGSLFYFLLHLLRRYRRIARFRPRGKGPFTGLLALNRTVYRHVNLP